MKKKLFPVALVCFLISSCTTAYKNIQTPDDVYYSPAPGQKVYTQAENQNDYYSDDNYLHMKAQNNNRWGGLDDYSYWNDSRYLYSNYSYSPYIFNNCWSCPSSFYNPYDIYFNYYYSPWNNWSQPYCTVIYYKNPTVYYGSTSGSNLSAYSNRSYNISNVPLAKGIQKVNYNNSNTLNTSSSNSKLIRLFSGSSSSSSGGRSGGFKSTGSGGNSRPPKPPM